MVALSAEEHGVLRPGQGSMSVANVQVPAENSPVLWLPHQDLWHMKVPSLQGEKKKQLTFTVVSF